jgi:hypothetical protein
MRRRWGGAVEPSLLLQKNGGRSPKGRQTDDLRLLPSIGAYLQIADINLQRGEKEGMGERFCFDGMIELRQLAHDS